MEFQRVIMRMKNGVITITDPWLTRFRIPPDEGVMCVLWSIGQRVVT